MAISAIIPPDNTIAGGVVYGGQTYTVGHNQLSGNTQGKIERFIELGYDVLDSRIRTDDLPLDDPWHPDNNPGFTQYNDLYKDGGNWIYDRYFYYRQNPNNLWMVERGHCIKVDLIQANDPTLGGEDRYQLIICVNKGFLAEEWQ